VGGDEVIAEEAFHLGQYRAAVQALGIKKSEPCRMGRLSGRVAIARWQTRPNVGIDTCAINRMREGREVHARFSRMQSVCLMDVPPRAS
jgi:hypothetical protein